MVNHPNRARKTRKQIEAVGALANLLCIIELAEEARQLDGNHAANACYIRNAQDCARWIQTVEAVEHVPAGVARHFPRLVRKVAS